MTRSKLFRTLLLWVLFGVLLIEFYWILRTTYKYVGLEDLSKLTSQIERQKNENNNLEKQRSLLQEELSEIQEGLEMGLSQEELLLKERDDYRSLAGFDKMRGEGVIVIFTDSDAPLYRNENPSDLIVHDSDVQLLISDLRNAGVEAISVNDERVVFGLSEVYCNGPTIRINGKVFSQPFIIKAIGPRKTLQAAIHSNTGHAFTMKKRGIFVEANTSIQLEIPAFDPSLLNREEE